MKRHEVDLELILKKDLREQSTTPYKTQDWDAELAAPLKQVRLTPKDVSHHSSLPVTPVGRENKKTQLTLDEKSKPKTRGNAQDTIEVLADDNPPADAILAPEDQARAPIEVPSRVFRVMSSLLPSPATISEAAREVSWKDFEFAFDAIGLVPEKLYGSVWIFKPLPAGEGLVDVERSIQFNEPKSVRRGNKIDAVMVRRLGDRLKRAFGWDGETFVCA